MFFIPELLEHKKFDVSFSCYMILIYNKKRRKPDIVIKIKEATTIFHRVL